MADTSDYRLVCISGNSEGFNTDSRIKKIDFSELSINNEPMMNYLILKRIDNNVLVVKDEEEFKTVSNYFKKSIIND